ncbi:hypothetical protein HPB47_016930, partial [Ixodes persulcatus]
VSLEHIKKMCELDEQHKLKLLPGLKLKDLNPNHFEEKKNGFSSCLVKPQRQCSHKMISRAIKTALSDFCPQKVYEAKVFLKNFKEMFSLLIILDKLSQGMWKPVQTGVLISTEAAFHLRNYFLNQQGFKYVFLSRFSQDILENLYSTTRRKTPNPRAREFRSAFRIIVLAQFFQPIRQGEYAVDDSVHLMDFLCKCTDLAEDHGEILND